MKKRFVAKKRSKFLKIKFILWLIVVIFSFWIVFSFLVRRALGDFFGKDSTQTLLIESGVSQKKFSSFNLLSAEEILNLSLYRRIKTNTNKIIESFTVDDKNNNVNPKIYIYNTHEGETYESSLLEAYNISYTVKTASYILRDYLEDYGIPCFVETESISAFLNSNGLTYKDSYKASRFYANKRLNEYASIEYLIDVHRDSANSTVTTVQIDGVSYAKIMFVIGLNNSNYETNLAHAEILSDRMGDLSRGISKKSGTNVNGVYNQDLNGNSILIEIGGVDNTIEEIDNTLKVLSRVIFEYISEV